MIAGHADEPGIGQKRGQFVGIRALIVIADRDKRGDGDLAQGSFRRRNERVEHVQQRPGIGAEIRDPVRERRVGLFGLDRNPVGERSEHAVIHAAALRTTDLCEPLPGHDRTVRLGASNEHAHHDPRTKRVATKVVLAVMKPEMIDECKSVVG